MDTEERDEVTQYIRTRGAVRVPEDAALDAASKPLRTRGAVTTRGTEAPPQVQSTKLGALVEKLRQRVGKLPLNVMVHGAPGSRSADFVTALAPFLRQRDAVWLVGAEAGASPTARAGLAATRTLDLERDQERRVHQNAVVDIVFFTGTGAAEADQVKGWTRRARVLIVDGRAPGARGVLKAGAEASIGSTYRWEGGDELRSAQLT